MKGNTVLVKTKQEENETGSLNVKNLKSGVYIISIQNSVKKYNQKIIIE